MRSPRKQSDPSLLIEVQGGDPGTWGCNEENSGKHLPRRGGGVARCGLRLLGLGSRRSLPPGSGNMTVRASRTQVRRSGGGGEAETTPTPRPPTGQATSPGEPLVRSGEKGDAVGRQGFQDWKTQGEGRTDQFCAVLSQFPQR